MATTKNTFAVPGRVADRTAACLTLSAAKQAYSKSTRLNRIAAVTAQIRKDLQQTKNRMKTDSLGKVDAVVREESVIVDGGSGYGGSLRAQEKVPDTETKKNGRDLEMGVDMVLGEVPEMKNGMALEEALEMVLDIDLEMENGADQDMVQEVKNGNSLTILTMLQIINQNTDRSLETEMRRILRKVSMTDGDLTNSILGITRLNHLEIRLNPGGNLKKIETAVRDGEVDLRVNKTVLAREEALLLCLEEQGVSLCVTRWL